MKELEIQPVVSVKGLSKTFVVPAEKRNTLKATLFNLHRRNPNRIFKALQDINFAVNKGEFFGIIGRNGSGKSTLLKILAQIYRPDPGSVMKIQGTISPFLELGVGFNPEMTARENVYLNAAILGLHKDVIDQRFDAIIGFAELEEFVDQKLKFFSSGMQVRLAFAVAIQVDADILLLDEVLAVGDASFQRKCFDVFHQFKKLGKTIIFVSHDLGSVRQFCSRVLYLKNSKVEMLGDANACVDHYIDTDDTSEFLGKKVQDESASTKPIRIEKVDFLDKLGNVNKKFVSGDAFSIRVSYRVIETNLAPPVLDLAIYRDDSSYLYGTSTFLQGKAVDLQKKGVVEFFCSNLPVIKGKFLVTLVFRHLDGDVYDSRDREFVFYVQKSNNDDGLVAFNFYFEN